MIFFVPGKVPLDPSVGRYCDEGKSLFEECPESPVVKVYEGIIKGVKEAVKNTT